MDLVISHGDFQRLTPATQRELLARLTGTANGMPTQDHNQMVAEDRFDQTPIAAYDNDLHPPTSVKRVIGITVEQASEMLDNLAEKSQQSLRLFAVAERVGIDELVGDERPYRDMNDLKRSFVGAVNRRLRTVMGNRLVVLFGSDRERRRIRVLPSTAAALRQAMRIPEPDVSEVFEEIEPGCDDL